MASGNGEYLYSSEDYSHTHNTNDMMRRALDVVGNLEVLGEQHLYALDKMLCSTAAEILKPAIKWWEKQAPDVMQDLAPANHWGTPGSAFSFWQNVLRLCEQHPHADLCLEG